MSQEEEKQEKQEMQPEINIITDRKAIEAEEQKPNLTVTTGIGEIFHVKIRQPEGRALLIAVHL